MLQCWSVNFVNKVLFCNQIFTLHALLITNTLITHLFSSQLAAIYFNLISIHMWSEFVYIIIFLCIILCFSCKCPNEITEMGRIWNISGHR